MSVCTVVLETFVCTDGDETVVNGADVDTIQPAPFAAELR